MKLKTTLKFIVPVILYLGIVGSSYYFFLQPQLNRSKQTDNSVVSANKLFGWKFPISKFPLTGQNGQLIAYSSIRDPGGIPKGLPVRLQIPGIGVDSIVEDALITPDGRMDVPAGSVNVAWFSLGPHPGQVGSAVIGGHFGISNGVPWVFYRLDQVKVGDKIYIIDDNNNTLAFIVRRIASFDRNADASPVFLSSDGLAHLNLITCEGTWNQVNGSYPLRLVVFADAVPSEGAITVNKHVAVVTKPNPTQVTTPLPTQVLTPTTNTSTPLPSANYVGQAQPTEKNLVPSNIINTLLSPQMFIASAQSLYATPLDGFITSLLLLGIVFLVFKLIRR